MFKRKTEPHPEEVFASRQQVDQFAVDAQQTPVRYRACLQDIKRLGSKGAYLDVGAGPGILASMLAQDNPDIHIVALEIAPEMIAFGQDYIAQQGLQQRIQYVTGDVQDREFMQTLGRFDLVYCAYTLHHFADPQGAIRSMLAAVKEGGVLYLHDLRRVWWLYWLPIGTGFCQSVRAAYLKAEVRDMLQQLGIITYEIRNVFPFLLSVTIRKAEPIP